MSGAIRTRAATPAIMAWLVLLAGACVLGSVIENAENNLVTTLDDTNVLPPGAASFLEVAAAPKNAMDKAKYVAIRSDDYDKEEGEEPEYHIRHLGNNIVLTTLSGATDRKNGAWFIHEPLCPPGFEDCPKAPQGSTGCFSLEAADELGSFLAKETNSDNVVLRTFPFADVVSATFCGHPGKDNPAHSTYEALAKPGFFITHKQFRLKLCNNNENSECGQSNRFKQEATFEQIKAKFYGRCHVNKALKSGKKKTTCKCIDNFVGKHCDLECPGGCGKGVCTEKEGGKEAYCKCEQGFVGAACDKQCAVNKLTETPCGSIGKCSMVEGKPACDCGVGFRGDACQHHCPAYNEKARTVCMGHGKCVLSDDKAKAGGRPTTCNCELGYIGGSCQVKCPHNPTNGKLCNGAGSCALNDETGKGECKCTEGFAGDACQFSCPRNPAGSICSDKGKCSVQTGKGIGGALCVCDQGFSGPVCEAACPGMLAGSPCNGHGRCSFVGHASDKAQAEAEKEANNAGAAEASEQEKEDKDAKVETAKATEDAKKTAQAIVDKTLKKPAKKPTAVSRKLLQAKDEKQKAAEKAKEDAEAQKKKDKAALDASDAKKKAVKPVEEAAKKMEKPKMEKSLAACTCDKGYGGSSCGNMCPRDENGEICGGHGECNQNGECVCASGFVGPGCEGQCPGGAAAGSVPCNENGECYWNPDTELAACRCKPGFLGASCKFACPRGGSALQICSGKGECTMQRGTATCVCQDGFLGGSCQLPCPGVERENVCNGHGHCHTNKGESRAVCTCHDGFLGSACMTTCPGLLEDGTACNGHGTCKAAAGAGNKAECTCGIGFLGDDCSIKCPVDAYDNVCAGAGKCQVKQHADGVKGAECVCAPGRVNYNCDASCPSNSADGSVCSGHGKCEISQQTDNYGNTKLAGVCKCSDGFLGEDCFHGCPTSKGNTGQCSGHGKCELKAGSAVCSCVAGFSGTACDARVCKSPRSTFNEGIEKCTCEAGYTCCSRESSAQEEERDAAIAMLEQQTGLLHGKLRLRKRQLQSLIQQTSK